MYVVEAGGNSTIERLRKLLRVRSWRWARAERVGCGEPRADLGLNARKNKREGAVLEGIG